MVLVLEVTAVLVAILNTYCNEHKGHVSELGSRNCVLRSFYKCVLPSISGLAVFGFCLGFELACGVWLVYETEDCKRVRGLDA